MAKAIRTSIPPRPVGTGRKELEGRKEGERRREERKGRERGKGQGGRAYAATLYIDAQRYSAVCTGKRGWGWSGSCRERGHCRLLICIAASNPVLRGGIEWTAVNEEVGFGILPAPSEFTPSQKSFGFVCDCFLSLRFYFGLVSLSCSSFVVDGSCKEACVRVVLCACLCACLRVGRAVWLLCIYRQTAHPELGRGGQA